MCLAQGCLDLVSRAEASADESVLGHFVLGVALVG